MSSILASWPVVRCVSACTVVAEYESEATATDPAGQGPALPRGVQARPGHAVLWSSGPSCSGRNTGPPAAWASCPSSPSHAAKTQTLVECLTLNPQKTLRAFSWVGPASRDLGALPGHSGDTRAEAGVPARPPRDLRHSSTPPESEESSVLLLWRPPRPQNKPRMFHRLPGREPRSHAQTPGNTCVSIFPK